VDSSLPDIEFGGIVWGGELRETAWFEANNNIRKMTFGKCGRGEEAATGKPQPKIT